MKYVKKTLRDLDLMNQTVVLRLDLNVPIQDGTITDDTRIVQSLPTLNFLLEKNCRVVVLSHLSRIKSLSDKQSGKKSLAPVAQLLAEKLAPYKVSFSNTNYGAEVVDAVNQAEFPSVLVLENTRYLDVDDHDQLVKLESKNDPELGRFWANLGDVFVNDAFGTAHRAHASNVGVATHAKASAIGLLVERELLNLTKACDTPQRPLVVVLGGAKVSDKLKVIRKIVTKADHLLIGGGMAYTFQKALGNNVGTSLVEMNMLEECKQLLLDHADKIVLPLDCQVSEHFANEPGKLVDVNDHEGWNNVMGMDIGPQTIKLFSAIIQQAATVVWNGPVGVFEFSHFATGTKAIAKSLVEITQKNGAFSLIGGGDSVAAFHQLTNNPNAVSFVSTGGGACLAYMEETVLPGIDAIENLAK